jgi:hypothetical protein
MIAETFRRSSDDKHIIAANIFQDTLAWQFAARILSPPDLMRDLHRLHSRIGSTSEGSSFFGLFTRWLIGNIFISSAGRRGTGFNPKTQQKIKIPAKTVIKFRVAKAAEGRSSRSKEVANMLYTVNQFGFSGLPFSGEKVVVFSGFFDKTRIMS